MARRRAVPKSRPPSPGEAENTAVQWAILEMGLSLASGRAQRASRAARNSAGGKARAAVYGLRDAEMKQHARRLWNKEIARGQKPTWRKLAKRIAPSGQRLLGWPRPLSWWTVYKIIRE